MNAVTYPDRLQMMRTPTCTSAKIVRCFPLFCSLCLHSGIIGTLLFFSVNNHETAERVYHVSLAGFSLQGESASPVQGTESASRAVASDAGKPGIEPVPVPSEPESALSEIAETRKISLRKKASTSAAVQKQLKPVQGANQPMPETRAIQPERSSARPQTGTATGTTADQSAGTASPSVTNPGNPSETYTIEQVDQKPSILQRVTPEYPDRAKKTRIEGAVVVQLVVDISGHATECAIQSADPPGYFEESALNATKKMRFIPGKIGGRPVKTLVLLPFAFKLR